VEPQLAAFNESTGTPCFAASFAASTILKGVSTFASSRRVMVGDATTPSAKPASEGKNVSWFLETVC
jgi:hypothetical protein